MSWWPCGVRARKRGGSSGKTVARAAVTVSANSFSSIRSHTLNRNSPPDLSTRRASENAFGLVGKEHDSELADHRVEPAVGERQLHRIRLAPFHWPARADLGRKIQHRAIEIGGDNRCLCRQQRREPPRDHAGTGGDFEHARARSRRQAVGEIVRVRLEDQRNEILGRRTSESSRRRPCRVLLRSSLSSFETRARQLRRFGWRAQLARPNSPAPTCCLFPAAGASAGRPIPPSAPCPTFSHRPARASSC